MDFSALNKHLLKECIWQVLKHVSPMSIKKTWSLGISSLLVSINIRKIQIKEDCHSKQLTCQIIEMKHVQR